MDFSLTPKVQELEARLLDFMESHVYPAERVVWEQVESSTDPYVHPPVLEELKAEARARGLWNLFLTDRKFGEGLTNLEYAPLAEITGRSPWIAPEALNCSAPDTGNMEILAEFGTAEQHNRWLKPLLEGRIRSCFAMTEPDVASSDPTNICARIDRKGDHYVISGRKWFVTGPMSARCRLAIVMGVTNPDAAPHHRHSMVLVPLETPGVRVVRGISIFGYRGSGGEAELIFEDAHVPVENLLGEEGKGFSIAQARLGPGRIHHCMRTIGMAERAFDLMCRRALGRIAFGKPIAEQGVIQDWIAESRMEIEQARLLILRAAWLMDTVGKEAARFEISAIKVAATRTATNVIDRAIQVHGAAGVSDDLPLARLYAAARTLRIADGPDEVHKMVLARQELRKFLD